VTSNDDWNTTPSMVRIAWKIPGVESLPIDHSVQQSPAAVVVHVKSWVVCPEVSRTLIDTAVLEMGPEELATSAHIL
jgi:hypothetical protein